MAVDGWIQKDHLSALLLLLPAREGTEYLTDFLFVCNSRLGEEGRWNVNFYLVK